MKMNNSTKQIWFARLSALILMSLCFSFLATYTNRKTGPFTHDIRIKANDNVEQIVNSVEALNRPDLQVNVHEIPWYIRNGNLLSYTIGFIITSGIFLGFYHVIYRLVLALLNIKKKNNNLIDDD